jgi:hypothetical protein
MSLSTMSATRRLTTVEFAPGISSQAMYESKCLKSGWLRFMMKWQSHAIRCTHYYR